MSKTLIKALSAIEADTKASDRESLVQEAYNDAFKAHYGFKPTRYCSCDGYLASKTPSGKELRILIEYKESVDFRNTKSVAETLTQCVAYMAKFNATGVLPPSAIILASSNSCFTCAAKDLESFTKLHKDWNKASSLKSDAEFVGQITEALDSMDSYSFDVDAHFDFAALCTAAEHLADNTEYKVELTMGLFETLFKEFHQCIRGYYNRLGALVKEEAIKDKEDKDDYAHDLVAAFLGCISCNPAYSVLSDNPKCLSTPTRQFEVIPSELEEFNTKYSSKDMDTKSFDAVSDRLIDEVTRLGNGQYYTPTDYVNFAHEEIARQFGADWKEKFIVWDNSAGTCNLTRDYEFKELYTSTLEPAEVEIGSKYNQEATHFQFDFLNDSIPLVDNESSMDIFFGDTINKRPCKLPEGLLTALKTNKPIMFFMNPPYVGDGACGATGARSRNTGSAESESCITRQMMKAAGLAQASNNLYAQFLYRILRIKQAYSLTNVAICVFCPTTWLVSSVFSRFREEFHTEFHYMSGNLFSARHFGISNNWGVLFSTWTTSPEYSSIKDSFKIGLLDTINGVISTVGHHTLINTQNVRLTAFCKSLEPRTEEAPNLSSGLHVKQSNAPSPKGQLGYMFALGNNVGHSTQDTAFMSSTFDNGGTSITADNVIKSMVAFSSRRLSSSYWVNNYDEYSAPDTDSSLYPEFESDSLVFSLFESKSCQSSLVNVDYHGKSWRVRNNFFFMSADEMAELGADTLGESDPYMYTLLESRTLSPEAEAVLDAARDLVKLSWSKRHAWGLKPGNIPRSKNAYMDYQIENWDCGFYQLKNLWKEEFPAEFKAFNGKFHALARKMKPQIYALGMLPEPVIFDEYKGIVK